MNALENRGLGRRMTQSKTEQLGMWVIGAALLSAPAFDLFGATITAAGVSQVEVANAIAQPVDGGTAQIGVFMTCFGAVDHGIFLNNHVSGRVYQNGTDQWNRDNLHQIPFQSTNYRFFEDCIFGLK
jgi:TRAP-type uncharacterized transport system fused permease subunit